MQHAATQFWCDSTGFMPDLKVWDIGVSKATLVLGRFWPERFSQRLFAHFQVEFPAKLSSAVAKRRSEFLPGRLALKYACHQLRPPDHPVALRRDRAPGWPAGVTGSISHTAGRCAALVAAGDAGAVGVDIKQIANREIAESIGRPPCAPPNARWFGRRVGWIATNARRWSFPPRKACSGRSTPT